MDPQTEGRTGLDPLPVALTADQKEKMGQASVSLSLITQQCLNKATSAQSAPLLLLVKLLHLLSFTSSSRPRLCPLFPTGERTVSEAHWAPYSAVSSLEMRFSSCWGLVFWGLCLFRADPKMKHKTQMRVFCFHCCVYAAAAGLVGGGRDTVICPCEGNEL